MAITTKPTSTLPTNLLFALMLSLFLVSCNGVGSTNTATEKFYTGTQGVNAEFDAFPNKLYYYSEPGNAYNEFEVAVEVKNEGASHTRGGVYLSGYDPNLIEFDEVPIIGNPIGGCGFSIGTLGFGNIGLLASCNGAGVGFGSQGLVVDIQSVMSLVNKAGWDESKFDVGLLFDNTGEQTIIRADLFAPGVDLDYLGHGRLMLAYFAGIDFTRSLGREYILPGRSYEFPEGGLEYLSYHGRIKQTGWAPGLDEVKQSVLLTNCYLYTTHAAPLVCIDPEPFSDRQKVCSPKQHTFSGSQGAPVAITSIEQENAGPRSIFRITIKNVGRGEVFDPGMIEKCSPYLNDRIRAEDRNVVYLGDVRIGNVPLQDCTPSGAIRLHNGQGTVTCSYPLQSEYVGLGSAYETPLYVELWYGYSDTEQKNMVIKRVT